MRRLLLAAFAAFALPMAGSATSIRPQSLPEMVQGAEQALQGTVVAARPVQRGTMIFTEYDVEVSDWLKPGRQGSPRTIRFFQPGGTVGDVTMTVVGAAHFAPGDEAILFTRDYSGLGQQVVNLSQGALPVAPGPPDARGPRRLPAARAFPGGAPEDLDAFKAAVRELAAGRTP